METINMIRLLTAALLMFTINIFSLSDEKNEKERDNKNKVISENPDTVKTYDFPQIDVIGKKPSLLNRIPGSASIISGLALEKIKPLHGNEVFRKVTGVHVVDEEGVGLRANIGIRGLDPDRSRTVLMMEDGVPIALAPYGEPEMYYTPSIDRMKRVEILKGSGSILFGPQTIGGVINYITNDPPIESQTTISLKGGSGGYFTGQAGYGTTIDNVGVYFSFLHKQADKLGTTNFDINDITAKFRFNTGEKSRVGVKLSAYDEISNSTYIGITQTMYDKADYYTIIAPYDQLDIRRYSGSITHDYFMSDDAFLRTTLFGYTTARNWLRQDFSRSPVSNGTGEVFGDTSVANGAIYMRNSTGNRNRQFEVAGIEPRIHFNYSIGEIKNELEGGLRFLYERAFEQRIDGRKADALSGDLREDEIRTGYAASIFTQNRVYLSEHLSVTPGLRLENFDYERDIFRLNFRDTSLTNNSSVFAVVPGLGANYNFNDVYSVFAGVHRGFAPPRVKDAITNGGESLELDAELSWNYELGLRAYVSSFLSVELTGYMLDFSNQIIPVSESSGGLGTGLVNGGETMHIGIETGLRLFFDQLINTDYKIELNTNLTLSKSDYSADRFITLGEEKINIKGNKLPYAPELYLSAMLDLTAPFGLGFQIAGTYIGEQFTDELNTIAASPDGQIGKMPAYFVLDVTGRYLINSLNSNLYVSIKNLLDERYIASRRPQGIKVGLPRFITAGIEVTL
jgi:Fe(3+) dicitrate transport protein